MLKKVLKCFCALGISCLMSQSVIAQIEEKSNMMNKKVLIAYYSYSGNTQAVAQAIHDAVGGDLFEIKTVGTYPEAYRPMTEQAKKEIQAGYRPELTTKIDDISQYDIVFLGSPNWWGTITPQVSSFLKEYNLSGKTIIPFITHGGGGIQNTISDMSKQCIGCHVLTKGWSGYGNQTSGIHSWLEEIGFEKSK